MSEDGGTGLLSSIVYAGFALGALGLTVRMVDNLTAPRQSSRRRNDYDDTDFLNYKPKRKARRNDNIFNWDF